MGGGRGDWQGRWGGRWVLRRPPIPLPPPPADSSTNDPLASLSPPLVVVSGRWFGRSAAHRAPPRIRGRRAHEYGPREHTTCFPNRISLRPVGRSVLPPAYRFTIDRAEKKIAANVVIYPCLAREIRERSEFGSSYALLGRGGRSGVDDLFFFLPWRGCYAESQHHVGRGRGGVWTAFLRIVKIMEGRRYRGN